MSTLNGHAMLDLILQKKKSKASWELEMKGNHERLTHRAFFLEL
jgi:hypothetical protein